MTSCHFITDGNLSLLSNRNTHKLVCSRFKLVFVFARKYSYVYDNSALAVRNLKRCISYFSCLFAENSSQESFLGSLLRLALRRYLSYENISRHYLRTYTDYAVFIEVLEHIVAYVRNFSCYFLSAELCISCLCLIFLYVY